jgi:hypothetical protein
MIDRNRFGSIMAAVLLVALVSLSCSLATGPSPTEVILPATEVVAATLTQSPAASQGALSPTLPPARSAPSTTLQASAAASQALALKAQQQQVLDSLGDLTRYNLRLDLDYTQHNFSGQSRVVYTNTETTTLEALNFRLFPNGGKSYGDGSLTITRALLEGQEVEGQLSLNDTVFKVDLPTGLAPGERVQMDFDFQGQVPEDFGSPGQQTGYGIYNFSQGVMAMADWYPVLAVYDDKGWNLDPVSGIGDSVYSDMAFYTVEVSLPGDLVLAATGVPASKQSGQGNLIRYRYVSGPTRDFFLVVSPDFKTASRTVEGTRVNSYFLPGHEQAGEQALQVAVDSLQAYSRRFGPYPYTELDVVDAPMRGAGGVEYPSIVLVAGYLYDEPGRTDFTVATAHEVAHQWWYNLVGNDVIDDPWMDEALATYSSALYYEAVQGEGAYQANVNYWQDRYSQVVAQKEDDLVTASLEHYENSSQAGSYGGVVYIKGALFFAELRQEIGEQAFFNALENYFEEDKYRIAQPQDMLNAFEQAAGRQLDAFYDQWLYSKRD